MSAENMKSQLSDLRKQRLQEIRFEKEQGARTKPAADGAVTLDSLHTWIVGIIGLLVVVAVYLMLPITYSASGVEYSQKELSAGMSTSDALATEEGREAVYEKLSIDFGPILTPAAQEHSQAMQRVAQNCLPSKAEGVVLPGARAFVAYEQASNYLLCAMQTEPQRLCAPAERTRLVEQLAVYKNLHANVSAAAVLYLRFLDSDIGKKRLRQLQARGDAPADDALHPELDPRVTQQLLALVQAGYLSASDFGFMGFVLPEEYIAFLTVEGPVGRACG